MPLALILSLVSALAPTLVQQAEKLFGSEKGTGPKKRQWVIDGVNAMLTAAVAHEPSWLRPANEIVEPLIDEGIEFALDKLNI